MLDGVSKGCTGITFARMTWHTPARDGIVLEYDDPRGTMEPNALNIVQVSANTGIHIRLAHLLHYLRAAGELLEFGTLNVGSLVDGVGSEVWIPRGRS